MTSSLSPSLTRADASPLLRLLEQFSRLGATPNGGVTRLCGSREDGQARDLFRATAEQAGASVATDAVGNQFARFPLSAAAAAPTVMMGSHLDSQSRAGRFDGTLGVAAALCTGAVLMQARSAGTQFNTDFIAVNWTNEEGARYRPSLLGSSAYAGHFTAEYALSRQDDHGISLRQALAAICHLGADPAPALPACYLELHIEQGSVLEDARIPIGVVRRNWGALKIDVQFLGEQAHTGPTLMARRRDALLGAAYAIAAIRDIPEHWPGKVHSSVARILVEPNSANVVPASVTIALEIRAADNELLHEAGQLAEAALAQAAARAKIEYEIISRAERQIRALPDAPAALLRGCATAAGLPCMDMATVAGHDALSLLGLCPIGLFFVPSINGITHNEAEDTAPEHLAAGFQVALLAAARLCRAGGNPEAAAMKEE